MDLPSTSKPVYVPEMLGSIPSADKFPDSTMISSELIMECNHLNLVPVTDEEINAICSNTPLNLDAYQNVIGNVDSFEETEDWNRLILLDDAGNAMLNEKETRNDSFVRSCKSFCEYLNSVDGKSDHTDGSYYEKQYDLNDRDRFRLIDREKLNDCTSDSCEFDFGNVILLDNNVSECEKDREAEERDRNGKSTKHITERSKFGFRIVEISANHADNSKKLNSCAVEAEESNNYVRDRNKYDFNDVEIFNNCANDGTTLNNGVGVFEKSNNYIADRNKYDLKYVENCATVMKKSKYDLNDVEIFNNCANNGKKSNSCFAVSAVSKSNRYITDKSKYDLNDVKNKILVNNCVSDRDKTDDCISVGKILNNHISDNDQYVRCDVEILDNCASDSKKSEDCVSVAAKLGSCIIKRKESEYCVNDSGVSEIRKSDNFVSDIEKLDLNGCEKSEERLNDMKKINNSDTNFKRSYKRQNNKINFGKRRKNSDSVITNSTSPSRNLFDSMINRQTNVNSPLVAESNRKTELLSNGKEIPQSLDLKRDSNYKTNYGNIRILKERTNDIRARPLKNNSFLTSKRDLNYEFGGKKSRIGDSTTTLTHRNIDSVSTFYDKSKFKASSQLNMKVSNGKLEKESDSDADKATNSDEISGFIPHSKNKSHSRDNEKSKSITNKIDCSDHIVSNCEDIIIVSRNETESNSLKFDSSISSDNVANILFNEDVSCKIIYSTAKLTESSNYLFNNKETEDERTNETSENVESGDEFHDEQSTNNNEQCSYKHNDLPKDRDNLSYSNIESHKFHNESYKNKDSDHECDNELDAIEELDIERNNEFYKNKESDECNGDLETKESDDLHYDKSYKYLCKEYNNESYQITYDRDEKDEQEFEEYNNRFLGKKESGEESNNQCENKESENGTNSEFYKKINSDNECNKEYENKESDESDIELYKIRESDIKYNNECDRDESHDECNDVYDVFVESFDGYKNDSYENQDSGDECYNVYENKELKSKFNNVFYENQESDDDFFVLGEVDDGNNHPSRKNEWTSSSDKDTPGIFIAESAQSESGEDTDSELSQEEPNSDFNLEDLESESDQNFFTSKYDRGSTEFKHKRMKVDFGMGQGVSKSASSRKGAKFELKNHEDDAEFQVYEIDDNVLSHYKQRLDALNEQEECIHEVPAAENKMSYIASTATNGEKRNCEIDCERSDENELAQLDEISEIAEKKLICEDEELLFTREFPIDAENGVLAVCGGNHCKFISPLLRTSQIKRVTRNPQIAKNHHFGPIFCRSWLTVDSGIVHKRTYLSNVDNYGGIHEEKAVRKLSNMIDRISRGEEMCKMDLQGPAFWKIAMKKLHLERPSFTRLIRNGEIYQFSKGDQLSEKVKREICTRKILAIACGEVPPDDLSQGPKFWQDFLQKLGNRTMDGLRNLATNKGK